MYVDVDVVCGRALRVAGLARVDPGLGTTESRRHGQHPGVLSESCPECQLDGATVPVVADVGRVSTCRHV